MIGQRSYTSEELATTMCALFNIVPQTSEVQDVDADESHAVIVMDTEIVDTVVEEFCDYSAAAQVYRDCFEIVQNDVFRGCLTNLEVKMGDSLEGPFAFGRVTLRPRLGDISTIIDLLGDWQHAGDRTEREFSIEFLVLKGRRTPFNAIFVESV